MLVGATSYSLKAVEPIFMSDEERSGVSNAADSVVEYAEYCELILNEKIDEANAKLADIAQYNKYDCKATLGLRNWLLELAKQNNIELVGSSADDPNARESKPPHPLFDELMGLIGDVPVADRTPDQTAIALSAAAIEFHRREDTMFWAGHFTRLKDPMEEWFNNKDVFVINEVEVVVDGREAGMYNFGGHEVGKHFLEPDVAEPSHRHHIAKPEVGRLVRDERRPPDALLFSGVFVEHEAGSFVEYGSHVFHTIVLEVGDEREVELLERQRYGRVARHPIEGGFVERENLVHVLAYFLDVAFAVQHAHFLPAHVAGDALKFACREGK
jgi:hypothetical protein